MNASSFSPPKNWVLRALLLLGLVAASCSVPNFEISTDAGVAASHCTNLIFDQGETGLDCGGTCPACAVGGACVLNSDCLGNQCVSGICQDASCTDGVQSGSETGTDCGGGACPPCASGLGCVAARDCASGVCLTGACAQPSCTDTIQNGDESDVDCGGACPACLPGQRCKLPSDCAGGDCTNATCSLTCLDGKGNCDGDIANGCETNLKTSADHCGACDTPCDLPHASALCNGGKCAVDKCTAPFMDCDGDPSNGCEVNTSTDAANCNACGTVCSAINGTASCAAAKCEVSCNAGFNDCDGDPVNGCETSTDKDVTNCGKCGNVCDTTSGSAKCTTGVCGVSNCKAGLGDCDSNPNDCETNTTNDVNNCGGCGVVCVIPNGVPSCVSSVCKVGSCNPGFADCNGIAKDGCETNIASDVKNCGACNAACAIGNATAKCENKVCKVSTCTAPYADCDANGLDCETNTSTSTANCGGCGVNGVNCSTDFPNATGKCVTSSCQLATCAANFGNCNGLDSDGCESNLKSDNNNCNACGTVCQAPHGTNTCTSGLCVPSCGTAFGDCDGNVKTGCEAVFANDPNNCGACATVCQQTNASNVCSGGFCSPTCSQTYFKSCDGNNNNGCEIDDRSSKANCGGCNLPCVDNQTSSNNCSGSACAPVCLTNHANCDGNGYNGCETPTGSDPNNCGGCNVQCKTQNASATSCGSGTCSPTCNNGFAACSNPAAGCLTSIDTAAHCGNCATSCTGGTPFCVSRLCTAHLDIGLVNSNTVGSTNGTGQTLILPHTLQTSAAANAYRFVVVGVTGFGNGQSGSEPMDVQYNGVDMVQAKQAFSGNQVSAAIYYLQGANLPASAGTYNVTVTPSGNNSFVLAANVIELTNVEQATSGLDSVGGSGTINSCTVHTPSDAVNVSVVGDYIYSATSVYGPATDSSPNTSGQTITLQTTGGSLGTFDGYLKATATGSKTITWTVAACSASAQALISIKPAVTP
ncbi:MAG TPA: hypothetical protein VNW92_12460 [Polyangiaceae bacterium]|nr:hypothetical protein [Polyangiaceae bacterium]